MVFLHQALKVGVCWLVFPVIEKIQIIYLSSREKQMDIEIYWIRKPGKVTSACEHPRKIKENMPCNYQSTRNLVDLSAL